MAKHSEGLRYAIPCILIVCVLLWYMKVDSYLFSGTTKFDAMPDRNTFLEVIRKLGVGPQLVNNSTDAGPKQIESGNREMIEARVNYTRRVCMEQGLPSKYTSTRYGDIGHMIVDDKYQLIFCYVPKVACTTWKEIFKQLFLKHKSGKRLLKDYSPQEIEQKLNSYRKAMFVRDPITRLLSAYLNKFKGHNPRVVHVWEKTFGRRIITQYRPLVAAEHMPVYNLNITLPEFIKFITNLGPEFYINEFQDHWLPTYRSCDPCKFQPDFIGHFENLASEGTYFLQWSGVDDLVTFPEVHAFNADTTLTKEYSNTEIWMLRELHQYYNRDYQMFNYSFDLTLKKIFLPNDYF